MIDLKIILLLILNTFSSIGFSLIAPLYPSLASSKNISESYTGVIFSSFSISNCLTIIMSNKILQIISRKKLLFLSVILEASGTIIFGLMIYINDPNIFILISLLVRLIQGFASSITSVLVYSIAASISEESNLKEVIGYMELAYSGGLTLGPIFASFFYYFGGYSLPFLICGILMLFCTIFIPNLDINEEEEYEDHSILKLLFEKEILMNFICLIVLMISSTFFHPLLTDHLTSKYGFTIEVSSLFFVINVFSYFMIIPFINKINHLIGIHMTILVGMISCSISSLLLSPIVFFPQNYYMIILGLLLLGFGSALIQIPCYVNFIEYLRFTKKIEDGIAYDLASSIFNLGINLGESIGPIFGVLVLSGRNFDYCCYSASVLSASYAILNYLYHFIKSKLHKIDEVIENEVYEEYKVKTQPFVKKESFKGFDEYASLRGPSRFFENHANVELAKSSEHYSFRYRVMSLSKTKGSSKYLKFVD